MPTPKQYVDGPARQRAYRQRQQQARNQERAAKGLPAAPPISTLPSQQRWQALHAQALAALTSVQAEMQNYYDTRSERWQESERGDDFSERIAAYEALITELEALQ